MNCSNDQKFGVFLMARIWAYFLSAIKFMSAIKRIRNLLLFQLPAVILMQLQKFRTWHLKKPNYCESQKKDFESQQYYLLHSVAVETCSGGVSGSPVRPKLLTEILCIYQVMFSITSINICQGKKKPNPTATTKQ